MDPKLSYTWILPSLTLFSLLCNTGTLLQMNWTHLVCFLKICPSISMCVFSAQYICIVAEYLTVKTLIKLKDKDSRKLAEIFIHGAFKNALNRFLKLLNEVFEFQIRVGFKGAKFQTMTCPMIFYRDVSSFLSLSPHH